MTENKQITMEIINSERFHRANVKFNGIPKEEIRKELKEAGWLYSRNNNLWYPKNEAAAASLPFAEHIKSTYFAESEELKVSEKKLETTHEISDKELLIQMINGGSSLNEIVNQMQEIYGENAVHEAFGIAKTVEKEAPQILKEAEEEKFDFEVLADKICQAAYEMSAAGFNCHFDFEHIANLANRNQEWVKSNLSYIGEALENHNDEMLLDFNLSTSFLEDENALDLNFCSVGEDANELFKKDSTGRWVRKTDKELREEELFNETYNQSELALQDTITDKYFLIQESAEGGWDWTLYDKELNEIDGGLAADITPNEKTQVLEAAKMILSDLNPEDFELTRWNRRDYDAIRELIHQVEQSKAIQAANEAEKAKATDENEPAYTIGGHTYKKSQIEAELREDIESIFRNLVPEPYLAGISLYQNPEKNGKINLLVQYGTDPMEGTWREDDLFNAIAEEEIYFNGLPVDVNPITPEKSGTIDEYLARLDRLGVENEEEAISKQSEMLEAKEETHKPKIYSFEPFGYEGTLVMIETDLRRGIPAYDIVGISDGMVKEVRERIRAAFRNSGLELPPERILQSVSPADIRKEGNIETLAMALDLLNEQNSYNSDDILVLGDLELSGRIRPVRSVHAAVVTAKANGITKVIVPEENAEEALGVEGVQVLSASSLSDLDKKLRTNEPFTQKAEIESPESSVEFDEEALSEIYDMNLDGYYDTARAIEIAIAGKHNILLNGAPGCGKTLLTTRLMPALTPKLTTNEAQTVTRIHSLAGLLRPDEGLVKRTPFRMPHQTASIEGICGGGPNCRPGEISLAHNGTLFLDEAAEFRSSVLQMLRVPLESGSITLSRAGRSTVYPANFQLAMATNPCPCGNYGSHDRLCLCSEKSIDLYWKKFSAPLIDRVEIKQTVDKDDEDKRRISVIEMKKHIENAFRIQREHEHYNSKLNAIEEANLCKLNEECQEYFDRRKDDYTPRQQQNMLKVALTIANMDNRREISLDDLKESVELVAPIFEKPHVYKRDQSTVKFGGFEYNSYYHSVKTRDLCHDIKQTENVEAHKKAVKEMADYLASQIKSLPGKVVLVPAPQHTGNAEYTLEIAKLIAAGNTNCDLLDVLKCEPHDTLYDQKKEGNRQPELNFYLKEGFDISSIPSDTKIFFIDNVISSGNTFNTANNLFDGRLFPLVYASSDFASFDIQDGKVVITDTREDSGINSVTRKEEPTISGGINTVTTENNAIDDTHTADEAPKSGINSVTSVPVQLTEVDLDICKMVIPPAQYRFTLELTQGEEGEFFKKKLKDIADTYRRINTDRTLVNEDGTHNVGFRYFLGNTEIYISQIYTDGIGFGYTILNGDLQMSEWGDSSIEEITSVPFIEMDYHIPEGATIERLLYERHPDYFEEPGIKTVTSEERENATSGGINTVTTQSDTTPGINSVTRNYSFYIRDTAEFEAFAEIEPVTGLSASEAVEKLLDLDTKDFSVGIGIVVPGSIDHGPEFEGTGVCEIYKRNGNWILDDIFLDSGHSVSQNENYIAAIDELLEEAENFGMEIEVPQVFHDLHKGIQAVTSSQPSAETSKSIMEEYPDGLYEDVIRKHVSEEALERISDDVKKIEQENGWSFSYETLKEYGEEYERAVKESDWETLYKIDYHLTDSNFHTECSLLSEYKFDEFKNSIAKEFGRELPESIAPVTEEIKTVTTEKVPKTKGQMKDIREQCREILQKPDSEIMEEDKAILAQYEGGGGLNEENRSSSEVLNEFYTPKNLVEKVWEIADHYSPDAVTVLEPSSGIGRFAENRPKNQFTMHEKNEVSARINRLLHPEATVIESSFQKQFFDEGERFRRTDVTLPTYDVVIGNPPYGDYNDKYKGLGEGKEFNRYEEYFISRGLDSLKDENSILVFVVPSGFLNTASDKAKHIIASKGILIDAYRLPEGTFPTTKVGTDIIVMKNRERCIDETYGERWENLDKYQKEDVIFTELTKISDGKWFKDHPETVLGQIKTRTNKFGKEEDYVTVRDGRTIQDELNRISDLLNGGDGCSNQMEPVYPAISKTDTTMTAKEFSKLYGKDFEEENYTVWSKADWEGKIKTSDLSKSEMEYLAKSKDYVQERPGTWTHRVLFESGDIYKKIDEQKNLLSGALLREDKEAAELFKKNIDTLDKAKKEPVKLDDIHISVISTLAEEFNVQHRRDDGEIEERNLAESFILWAQGESVDTQTGRRYLDFSTARISREELPDNVSWYDIVDYIDKKKVAAQKTSSWSYGRTEDEIKELRRERKKEADEKRMARSETANRLFDRYIHEGLDEETRERFLTEYNRRFNSYVIPKYENLPLYIDGMNAYKGKVPFKLYDQQLKGVARLSAKGNGLLAYDVGVGKTATGIVANINQIQTGRSHRPLIMVPNSVYAKWVTDIRQLFPNIQVNELYNFSDESISAYRDEADSHKLNIPVDSISVCTYEALKHITFTDESCEKELFADFANLLSADFDGTANENAAMEEKIKGTIGAASAVKDANYVFFERCGFDNITVDEAHNFKNLWVTPKPHNKGESQEYAGIPSGTPSKRAIKLFAMTQLTQRRNDDRNVFLLTATPFTNSPLEVYSMLTYVGRQRLVDSGIYSLRDFMNQFAHTKLELGVNTKGEIDYKQVMKDWKELPALQNLLTEFIDKVDGEEAGIIRPKKFTHVKELDLSPLQKKIMEREEERMTTAVSDNPGAVLKAMNNMRIALVSPALLNKYEYDDLTLPELQDFVECSPKLKFVCDAIIDMYKEHPDKGQFMYMPLGKEGHGIVKDYLVAHGVPKSAVEIVNGEINNTPEKKEKITTAFNDPKNKLKIVIGGKNTSEGIDLNGNSFVMYNCSLGWNPSETIQAEGRIWRQGNIQGHVHVVYPVMTDSIDSLLYQKHDEKRSRINDLWTYKGNNLNVEDINPEELKFELIKDPNKRVKLILDEETKELKEQLSKIKLKTENFDEIIEKKIHLKSDLEEIQKDSETHQNWKKEYEEKGEEVPSWLKSSIREDTRNLASYNRQKDIITEKLTNLNIHNEEEADAYIHGLNEERHGIEKQIDEVQKKLPALLEEMKVRLAEQKLTEHPVESQRKELEAAILTNLRPMADIIEEMKKASGMKIEKAAEPYVDEKGEYYLFNVDDISDSVNEDIKPYKRGEIDDHNITQAQIEDSRKERDNIVNPVLEGEKTGMWKAFNEFKEHGVFDIVGGSVELNSNKRISRNGWKQLQAAMNIYRNKKFETFRYVLVSRHTGRIEDQLAVSSHMPDACVVSSPDNNTLRQVIARAEAKDCLIVAVHNHPSGNTEASIPDDRVTKSLRQSCRRSDGLQRFAGHIILDHDNFNLYSLNRGWNRVDVEPSKSDELVNKMAPELSMEPLASFEMLKKVAEKINDTNSWNDDFIPVVFTNADRKVNALQYYHVSDFFEDSMKLKNKFTFAALDSGSNAAFPIVTDACLDKMGPALSESLENHLKEHLTHNVFTDAAIKGTTISEKYSLKPGENFFSEGALLSNKNPEIKATWDWKTEVDPRLFPSEYQKKKVAEIER